jgi:hypothetical protein
MKKIVPAAGMLAISATMLATSTYAWFTMSREVEVKNIQMTATVPEDIQISLGQINSDASTPSATETYALNNSTGWLTLTSNEATAPRAAGTANDELDWSNTADISAYYSFGKLIPASSTSGANIYYTPDANGVGKTVKGDAAYYQAAAGATAYKAGTSAADGITADTSAKATSHIYSTTEKTAADTHTWGARTNENASGYKTATDYANTYDDGYYIDIPVWLRTSSTVAQDIYVTGYVTKGTGTTDTDADDVLYQAVRVAILDGASSGAGDSGAVNGCVLLKDGASDASYPTSKLTTATSILDSDNYNTRTTGASGVNALSAATPAYAAITQNDGDDAVCTLAAGTGQEYGAMSKLYIRVWLEGEDGDCWNENAGQDWNISLKFSKEPLTAASTGD